MATKFWLSAVSTLADRLFSTDFYAGRILEKERLLIGTWKLVRYDSADFVTWKLKHNTRVVANFLFFFLYIPFLHWSSFTSSIMYIKQVCCSNRLYYASNSSRLPFKASSLTKTWRLLIPSVLIITSLVSTPIYLTPISNSFSWKKRFRKE